MPVEIRELIIRVTATDEDQPKAEVDEEAEELSLTDRENIVQEAVRRVLQILEKQRER